MKNVLLMLAVGFLGLMLVTADAEARRFGGGKSLGRQSPSYSREAAPPQAPAAAPRQQAVQPTVPASGARRWLGPLAGLAAGGLLAAMLFGDGFEGLQFLDILLLAALVIGGIMVFRALRARSAAPAAGPRPSYAGTGGTAARFEAPEIGSGVGGAGTAEPRPAWFNEQEFLRAAKTHFVRLQSDWDRGDLQDIQGYTTPELYAELVREREQLNDAEQFTEVVSLNAELLGLATEGDQVVASVRYSGLIREARGAEPHAFSEIWHVQRALNEANASWYVAGIQQEDLPAT